MKWQIPAKTFLLGEYAALSEGPALLVTTSPCFELSLSEEPELLGIHPESPAGLLWQQEDRAGKGLSFHDPYSGLGGLGASSAQFVGCYLAICALKNKAADWHEMLSAYYQYAFSGKGLRPSGYDVIAQAQQACVFINKKQQINKIYQWPFSDLSFTLIHTEKKLATHHHLQESRSAIDTSLLGALVEQARHSFEQSDSELLVHCINRYHQELSALNLVAAHSAALINEYTSYHEILACKGCGALGADVLLLISKRDDAYELQQKLKAQGKIILASELCLYLPHFDYFKNNP